GRRQGEKTAQRSEPRRAGLFHAGRGQWRHLRGQQCAPLFVLRRGASRAEQRSTESGREREPTRREEIIGWARSPPTSRGGVVRLAAFVAGIAQTSTTAQVQDHKSQIVNRIFLYVS